MTRKILITTAVSISSLLVIIGIAFCYLVYFPFTPNDEAPKVEVFVRWGSSFSAVADQLYEGRVIRDIDQFKLTAKIFDKTQKLRVGKFTLSQGMSNYAALRALVSGPQTYVTVTLPNGYDSRKFAKIIEQKLEIDSVRFVSLIADSIFIKELGISTTSLEGYLYPETYQFTFGINAKQVVKSLVAQFRKSIPDSLFERAGKSGWDEIAVLTMASIIEGEAMVDEELSTISSVYHNRLKKDIKLQADPTIQYIIPDGPRRLLHKDLRIDSPYNTYLYPGLPPGPINNPGIEAIKAAVFPAKTDYIYFVANGDGTHTFSRTYRQHLRAKSRFDEIRRTVELERKKELNEQQ